MIDPVVAWPQDRGWTIDDLLFQTYDCEEAELAMAKLIALGSNATMTSAER